MAIFTQISCFRMAIFTIFPKVTIKLQQNLREIFSRWWGCNVAGVAVVGCGVLCKNIANVLTIVLLCYKFAVEQKLLY